MYWRQSVLSTILESVQSSATVFELRGNLKIIYTRTSVLVLATLATSVSLAQSGSSPGSRVIEEITVTARKVEESLQDVPISISAYTKREMDRRELRGLEGIALATPGLSFEHYGGGFGVPVIRGGSQLRIQDLDATTSVYLDGIYLARQYAIDVGTAALDRIEVVKGPQSALFGRNAFMGAINYVSARPSDELDLQFSGTIGSDERYDVSGEISGPIAGERLRGRLLVAHSEFDGTFRSEFPAVDNRSYGRRGTTGNISGFETRTVGINPDHFYPAAGLLPSGLADLNAGQPCTRRDRIRRRGAGPCRCRTVKRNLSAHSPIVVARYFAEVSSMTVGKTFRQALDNSNPDSSQHLPDAISRRAFCGAALPAALLPAALLPTALVPAVSSGADASGFGQSDLLKAMIKMRGSLDSEMVIGWVRAKRFAVSQGQVEPIYGLVAATLSRFTRISDDLYSAVVLEVTHYTDLHTGELLETLVMPFSGHEVAVPAYRFGPETVRFAVHLDEETAFAPVAGTTEGEFAPAGAVRMTKSIEQDLVTDDELFIRHEEYGRVYPHAGDYPTMFYRESTLWTAPTREVLARDTRRVNSRVFYSAMTSWRPWMQMGEIPGHTTSNGMGGTVNSMADLPADFLRFTQQVHPDVLADPEAALDARKIES